MSRKTFKVEEFKDKINGLLLNTDDNYQMGRDAATLLVESVLLESGNYNGFRYLDADDMLKSNSGTTVGILGVKGTDMDHSERFEGTDYTRVKYY